MSHELRTPLNAVIGFSDVLLERMFGELNERQDEYLQDIRNSGRHLLELINEILDLSKVEAGRMELELGAGVAAPGCWSRAWRWCASGPATAASSLRLEIDPDVGVVWADELKLKQVVLNLLTNAVKFTPTRARWWWRRAWSAAEVEVTVTRHRRRDRRERAGADLRGVPARRARCPQKLRGHRPRADARRSGSSSCTAAGCG